MFPTDLTSLPALTNRQTLCSMSSSSLSLITSQLNYASRKLHCRLCGEYFSKTHLSQTLKMTFPSEATDSHFDPLTISRVILLQRQV